MTDQLDFHAINHMMVAINCEMSPSGRPHPDSDTLFMGGTPPSIADVDDIGRYACAKNYKVVYLPFHETPVSDLRSTFHVAVTDGIAQTIMLSGGRLWKRNARSPAVLMFSDNRLMVSLSAKGLLRATRMPANVEEQGYETALRAVMERAAEVPGGIPVVAPLGRLLTALDLKSFSDTFAKAA